MIAWLGQLGCARRPARLCLLVLLCSLVTATRPAAAQDLDDLLGPDEEAPSEAALGADAGEDDADDAREDSDAAGEQASVGDADDGEPAPLFGEDSAASEDTQETQGNRDGDPGAATPGLYVRLDVGAGMGTFGFRRPIGGRVEVLPDTLFAGLEGELAFGGYLGEAVALDGLFEYRTSVGMVVELAPLFALPERIDARVQAGSLSLAPRLHLGHLTLGFPVGFAATVWTLDVHQYPAKGFAYGGPFLRADVALRLGPSVTVRVAPEAQWLLMQAGALADENLDPGIAIGGLAVLGLAIDDALEVGLQYQERRGFSAGVSGELRTVERLLSARLTGAF